MADQIFVSPGVYTSELDIQFITRQVGVTTLGLVGETTKGPAFQPIFISNYGEFMNFFGGLNATKVKDTGAPQFELPYIAKSYLSQSNQLFVTRVLGFSGYDAGLAWAITLSGALDPATVTRTSGPTNANPLITWSATTGGTITSIVSSNSALQGLINLGIFDTDLAFLGFAVSGDTASIPVRYTKINGLFSGASIDLKVTSTGISSGTTTGSTSGFTNFYSGSSYTETDNQIVALLRSRGTINSITQVPNFEVSVTTNLIFDAAYPDALTDPLGDFSLSGYSNVQGAFDYTVSLDKNKRNYLPKVLGRAAQDGKAAIFVEELFDHMFANLNGEDKIYGINETLIQYNRNYFDYKNQFTEALTPYVVSEVRGNKVLRLFRFHTISDGNAANEQFKISIINIKPDTLEFDILVRAFNDTDANPQILERFTRCTMDPTSDHFVARKIGTTDGLYPSNSVYVLLELETSSDTSAAFPAGFVGYPIRDYQVNSNTGVVNPEIFYKNTYDLHENKRKVYLGLSDVTGIDADFFDYKGVPMTSSPDIWTGMTQGFHMDIDASGVTIDNVTEVINSTGGTFTPVFVFETGDATFTSEAGVVGGPYEKVYSRKFTFVPFGGFDGWDVYNTRRTNTDDYLINRTRGINGLSAGTFTNRTLTNGDVGITSDYYAYLEAMWTFRNVEAININVFATPGIDNFDNKNLVNAAIEMVEEDRADSLYIMTTPDTDNAGNIFDVTDVTAELEGDFDSNYSCTYWPWIQINDAENNVYVYVPPTRDVVRNIALTDNIAFPWFAVAGVQRGDVDAIKARVKLTLTQRDDLYENRINPIATFTSEGIKIWGNKTLQVKETPLNRINVRRLLLQARKLISAVAIRLLFEQNDSIVRNQFLSLVNPILDNIRTERGLTDFRIVLSNNPEDIDKQQLTGQIFLKPTKALEYIKLEFVVMNSGASFDNI